MEQTTVDERNPDALLRVEIEKARRAALYARLAADSDLLIQTLVQWSRDVVQFARDCCWVPDESGDFGGGSVPFRPYDAQEELLQKLTWMVATTRRRDMSGLKSRQVGWTADVLLFMFHNFLYKPGFNQLLITYQEKLIDKGGKGRRGADSLFGKLRRMMDQLVKRIPALAFNQGIEEKMPKTPCGALATQDANMSMIRPKWIVAGQEIFPEAEGNLILGEVPSDTAGKSLTFRFTFMDELGEYRVGLDRDTWKSVAPCCRHILGAGTIPKDGSEDSLLYELTEMSTASSLSVLKIHWTDIPAYLHEAYFDCDYCTKSSPYPFGPPKENVVPMTCSHCGRDQTITRLEVRSPWFDDMCATFNDDPVAIGRYLQMDWYASAGDVAFYTFRPQRQVCARAKLSGRWSAYDGFDPGWNRRNPAAWLLTMLSEEEQILRIVAYHMAQKKPIEWWLPFMMRWGLERMKQVYVLRGGHTGASAWEEHYHYTEEERQLIEIAANYPRGIVYGDDYGEQNHAGGGTAYSVLRQYGAKVIGDKVPNKFDLIVKARDTWIPRTEIEPNIANYKPANPDRQYPSIVTCLSRVKMREPEKGQTEGVKDFNKVHPHAASHPADAYLYIVQHLSNEVEGRRVGAEQVEVVPAHEAFDDRSFYGELLPGTEVKR